MTKKDTQSGILPDHFPIRGLRSNGNILDAYSYLDWR